jgi:murein DD-endopeptidase MepM/ murein hydrolase activator NlpD
MFNQQYNISYTPEIEIRYRTETRTGRHTYTDPATGERYTETYTYTVEVPYEWHILNVKLTSRPYTEVIMPYLNREQIEIYSLLMRTKGSRQYLRNVFDFNWIPYISSYYGYRIHPIEGGKNYHKGIDIAVSQGTPIFAGMKGTVTTVGFDAVEYGNYVAISDGKGLVAKYAHLSEVLVTERQSVLPNDIIGKVGSTGQSTGPHLHLEIIKDGIYLNPLYFVETGDDGRGYIPPGAPGGYAIPDYPGEPMPDELYAAMLEEAQRHLGKPYIWGAAGPDSFDCSGYVSYVFNHSGVADLGRLTGQGLFAQSTPVSRENACPGDLIFFTNTYSSPNPVSHVGIYIGNGMMIHCGKPVQYASIETGYWKSHFYAFGRLN